jgi:hypothetical protein
LGRLGNSEAFLVSRRIAAVIHDRNSGLIALGFVDHATLTAALGQPLSIGFAGKPA